MGELETLKIFNFKSEGFIFWKKEFFMKYH